MRRLGEGRAEPVGQSFDHDAASSLSERNRAKILPGLGSQAIQVSAQRG